MVCYVILRRFLRDVPPKLSFWNTCISARLTPQQGHLRGVKFPDSTIWKPVSNNNNSLDDTVHTVLEDYKTEFETNDGNDWLESNNDNENNDAFHDDAKNSNQLFETNHNPPPTRYWKHQDGKVTSQWYLPSYMQYHQPKYERARNNERRQTGPRSWSIEKLMPIVCMKHGNWGIIW